MKTLVQIWKNKWLILEGIIGYYFTKKKHQKIAAYRMDICMHCPLFDVIGTKCLVPGTQPCCGSCGCSSNLKVHSMSSSCPEGHWDAIMTEEQEDALNEKINNSK